MHKKVILLAFAVFFLFLTLNSVLAYHYSSNYNYPTYTYSYPSYNRDYSFQQFPSYINSPIINDKLFNSAQSMNSFNRNFQGPIIQRDTNYDEKLKIKGSRISRTISATTSEKYIGAVLIENGISQASDLNSRDFSSVPTNPSSYNGGSYWRFQDEYKPVFYGRDSYTNDYYYKPKYDWNNGHYNWRY